MQLILTDNYMHYNFTYYGKNSYFQYKLQRNIYLKVNCEYHYVVCILQYSTAKLWSVDCILQNKAHRYIVSGGYRREIYGKSLISVCLILPTPVILADVAGLDG